MPQAQDPHYAAVYFMDGGQVLRQMKGTEFDAFLDGYVGLSDLTDTDVKAVYVVISPALAVESLVFFRIYFDEEGRADPSWNIPVEALGKQGGRGPDLGGGPIRLVCRSQCPDPAVAGDLWDPDMTPGSNDFQAIRKAVEANRLGFQRREAVVEEEIPVLTPAAESERVEVPDTEAEHRKKLAWMIREQRLRIKTLQSAHRDQIAELQRQHRLEVQSLRREFQESGQRMEQLRVANEQLKQRLAERNAQYLSLQAMVPEAGEEPSPQTVSAETVLLQEQLERKQRELDLRAEQVSALERQYQDLQERQPDDDSLMARVRNQEVFVVAYHPGVGHITLPYDEISDYFDNPVAYAAEKCGLSEPAYRQWLDHYEHPVCRFLEDGEPCGAPVLRVAVPADFVAGRDDRCDIHLAE
ncbi:DNA repair protein [Mangrovitalea sediminis]|uniref:DNA repair protein n=1 Tax=Mangrovitalea sediminis TaxID=1982043 RepID=UPI000BE4B9CF|nr:DNA repair protein [Mangrovitalea sediminis]